MTAVITNVFCVHTGHHCYRLSSRKWKVFTCTKDPLKVVQIQKPQKPTYGLWGHSSPLACFLMFSLIWVGVSLPYRSRCMLSIILVCISPWDACCLIKTNWWVAQSNCRTLKSWAEIVNLQFSRHFYPPPWLLTYPQVPCSVQNTALFRNLLKWLFCHSDLLKE